MSEGRAESRRRKQPSELHARRPTGFDAVRGEDSSPERRLEAVKEVRRALDSMPCLPCLPCLPCCIALLHCLAALPCCIALLLHPLLHPPSPHHPPLPTHRTSPPLKELRGAYAARAERTYESGLKAAEARAEEEYTAYSASLEGEGEAFAALMAVRMDEEAKQRREAEGARRHGGVRASEEKRRRALLLEVEREAAVLREEEEYVELEFEGRCATNSGTHAAALETATPQPLQPLLPL